MAGRIKTGCFLGAEAALYLGFLALDLLRPGSGWALLLKYGAVALCFLAALDRAGTEDGRLVCAALAFTLAADWFLLILDSFYLAGVACFCVVQAIYLLRLHRWGAGLLWPLRVGLTVAALAVVCGAPEGAGAADGCDPLLFRGAGLQHGVRPASGATGAVLRAGAAALCGL